MTRGTLWLALWKQNRPAIIILLTLLFVCATLLLLQSQLFEPELEQLRSRQTRLQQQLREQQQQVTQSGVPMSTAERIDDDLQRFREMIPAKQDFSNFVGDLFTWAERAGLAIDQINYRPEIVPEMEMLSYGLSFSVQGSYAQLKRFIHLLENSSRLLVIDKIALAGSNDPLKNDNEVALQIELTTYFQEVAQ